MARWTKADTLMQSRAAARRAWFISSSSMVSDGRLLVIPVAGRPRFRVVVVGVSFMSMCAVSPDCAHKATKKWIFYALVLKMGIKSVDELKIWGLCLHVMSTKHPTAKKHMKTKPTAKKTAVSKPLRAVRITESRPRAEKKPRIREAGRERQRYNLTLSDDVIRIINKAKPLLGLSRSAFIELCVRRHAPDELAK